jgi:hypothetical protein
MRTTSALLAGRAGLAEADRGPAIEFLLRRGGRQVFMGGAVRIRRKEKIKEIIPVLQLQQQDSGMMR